MHDQHTFGWNALHSILFTCNNELWCVVIFSNKIINSHAAKQLNGVFSLLSVDSSKRLVYTMRVYNLLFVKIIRSFICANRELFKAKPHTWRSERTISNGKNHIETELWEFFTYKIAERKNDFWLMNCFTTSAPNRWHRRSQHSE